MGLNSTEDRVADSLQDILRIAHNIKEMTGVAISHTPGLRVATTDSTTEIDSISLPRPHSMLSSLVEAGLSREIAVVVNKAYQVRANELRQYIQESIIKAYREIMELPVVDLASSSELLMRKVVYTSTELYLRRLEQWKEEIVRRTTHIPEMPSVTTRNSPFNHKYVPLLELFFEENPFPVHADKLFLAKKSNMQYRQIHVWFQNRRNRAKKEGKKLRRPTYEETMKLPDSLYEHTKCHVKDSNFQVPKSSKECSKGRTGIELAQTIEPKDEFASSSPPHAFPSPYPPACHYDPFPCKSIPACFDKPGWRRVPGKKAPLPLLTSIDDLIESFSHLNVRDETRFRLPRKLQSYAATAAITVIPSRAPHPSLVVCQDFQPTNVAQLHPSACAPAFNSNSPSPVPKPVALMPSASSSKSGSPRNRKISPLPRRSDRTQDTARSVTPTENSSTSSPYLFSLDAENRSRSSLSVGSLSTSSGIPDLLHSFGLRCHSVFDNSMRLLGSRDMMAISSAPVS